MKKAFTLIELLIVVIIVTILATIALPNVLEAKTRAKVSRAMAETRQLGISFLSLPENWDIDGKDISEVISPLPDPFVIGQPYKVIHSGNTSFVAVSFGPGRVFNSEARYFQVPTYDPTNGTDSVGYIWSGWIEKL